MDENSEMSFLKWLWNGFKGLKGLTGLYAESRSKKERDFGSFLLVTQVAWIVLPPTPIKLALHISQILLGISLMLHGNYLKSLEEAEEKRRQERESRRKEREHYKWMRESFIRHIAERDGIGLEEAAKKADEAEWFVPGGGRVPPPWVEKEEEVEG